MAMAGATLGIMAIPAVIVIAALVLCAIGGWKMFVKMGEPGWKVIIPIYNAYILYKKTWVVKLFWIYLAASVVGSVLKSMGENGEAFRVISLATIGSLVTLVSSVIMIMLWYKVSKCFGHGIGFTIGLVLLAPIFIMILGFGSSVFNPPLGTQQTAQTGGQGYPYAPVSEEPLYKPVEPLPEEEQNKTEE